MGGTDADAGFTGGARRETGSTARCIETGSWGLGLLVPGLGSPGWKKATGRPRGEVGEAQSYSRGRWLKAWKTET